MSTKQARTKRQLVSAAIDVFHENGFQKSRISDIVAKAGVAQGTFYIYFKSKEEIFHCICAEFKTMFMSLLDDAADMFTGASIEDIRRDLHRFIHELITLFTANYKMARLVFVEGSGHAGKFGGIYESIYADFIGRIAAYLPVGQQRGHIAFEDAETEAAFLIGLFDSSLFYFMRVKHHIDIDNLSRRMTDFILGGLTKQQPNSD